jgi:hypothetical protein
MRGEYPHDAARDLPALTGPDVPLAFDNRMLHCSTIDLQALAVNCARLTTLLWLI